MIDKSSLAYIIIHFVKTFAMIMCMFYASTKIGKGTKITFKQIILFLIFGVLISGLYTYLKKRISFLLCLVIICILFTVFMSRITKKKVGYSLISTLISYALCSIALLFSVVMNFIPYNYIYKNNYYLNTLGVILLQMIIIFTFFKIKRFNKGFAFLNDKLNNDVTDIVVTFMGIVVLLIITFLGNLYEIAEYVKYDLIVIAILLGITMFIMIQRMLTMHYKQTQLIKTLEEYKNEIDAKDSEIEKLNKEKYNTSKIRHEFYHRQKALEMLVASQYNNQSITANTNQNILEIINNLTLEYSKECERIKALNELDKTDIPEIDSMFRYMQNECAKNDIEFKLKVIGNIHPLINNKISKSRLETLIGDHIKDAINAVNNDNIDKKEILVILGVKDNCYELAINDTGKEFEIDTLLKLGIKATTTCENKGGSGIGFMTTFETLAETKASLIITENDKKSYYSKCVAIRFDDKNQYIVRSYRANEIKQLDNENRIIFENLQ